MCVCVCVCARACVRACVSACVWGCMRTFACIRVHSRARAQVHGYILWLNILQFLEQQQQ